MIKKIIKKLNLKTKNSLAIDPFIPKNNEDYKLKLLSKFALNLYEKRSDINKFTKLALSDKENSSHEKIVEELVKEGIIPESVLNCDLEDLVNNKNFLKDLEID